MLLLEDLLILLQKQDDKLVLKCLSTTFSAGYQDVKVIITLMHRDVPFLLIVLPNLVLEGRGILKILKILVIVSQFVERSNN